VGRRGHRRRPHAAARAHDGEIAHAALDDVLARGHRLERRVVEPDVRLAVDDGDGGGHGARAAHLGLELAGDPQVVGPR
jgi:hypothetical protein